MSFLDFPGLQYFYNKYLKPIKPHAREETIKSYTVNEQGHVPDAQLVVQLKEENESLQEEIEKLNSALSTLNPITIPLTENVASYYIHAGKMVIGFVNAKSASAVTTIVLNDMPSPQSDGYIIETLNSYNGEKYSLAYETDHWSLRADSRQIAVNEWLRFPIVYLSK